MDFLATIKAVEQFAYELMSWVFFYPLTMIRVVLRPRKMLDYVAREIDGPTEPVFANAMRPALFLLLSLTIGVLLVPLSPDEVARISTSRVGKAITESLVALVVYRMIVFTTFPIVGAIICDLSTPGEVTRVSLERPFAQQCYLMAPFALVSSPSLTLLERGNMVAGVALILAHAWLLGAQTMFFRDHAKFGWLGAVSAALAVIVGGAAVNILVFLLLP